MQNQPIYLKAITLKDISDVDSIKDDAKRHMILIVRITPMAQKDIETLRKAIDDLYNFVKSAGEWMQNLSCVLNWQRLF